MTHDVAGEQGSWRPQIPEHVYFLLLVDLSHCLCAPALAQGLTGIPGDPVPRCLSRPFPGSGGGRQAAAIRQSHWGSAPSLLLGGLNS